MRLLIAAIGKLKQGPERVLFDLYAERAAATGRIVSLGPVTLEEIPESRCATPEARREAEAVLLLNKTRRAQTMTCLDRGGEQLSSEAFAALLARLRDEGTKSLAFAIGGPDGLGEPVLAEAQRVLSLGPLTLPHGLARVVLAEQLYRAATILAGHPYHRS